MATSVVGPCWAVEAQAHSKKKAMEWRSGFTETSTQETPLPCWAYTPAAVRYVRAMDATENDALERFVASIATNLQKNGFPERSVAFSLERMYESAAQKGLSFNKVLEVLAERGVAHQKTPEKVIFPSPLPVAPAGGADPFAGMDMSALGGMSPEQLMAAASEAAQRMSPEQMQALQAMVGNMSPEQMQMMMEQARKLGLG